MNNGNKGLTLLEPIKCRFRLYHSVFLPHHCRVHACILGSPFVQDCCVIAAPQPLDTKVPLPNKPVPNSAYETFDSYQQLRPFMDHIRRICHASEPLITLNKSLRNWIRSPPSFSAYHVIYGWPKSVRQRHKEKQNRTDQSMTEHIRTHRGMTRL